MDSDDVVSHIRYQSNLLELLAIGIEEIENASENDFPKGSIDLFSKILFYLGEHYQKICRWIRSQSILVIPHSTALTDVQRQLGISYKDLHSSDPG